jgi:hypothetical protein
MRRTDRSSAWLTRLALGGLLLLAAGPLRAYVIYLKDGSSVEAREKYTVRGNTALIVLPNGSQTTLPLAQIDVARTQSGNASDFGSATVLRGPAAAPAPAATPRQASLGELAAQRRNQSLPPKPPQRAENAPFPTSNAAAAEAPKGGLSHTLAGNVDFLRVPRTPAARMQLATTVGELLRSHGVNNVGIYEGSQPGRLLLEVVANSEGAVFQAIAGAAQSMLELEAKQPHAVDAFELFLATDNRQRAGQFLITAERAQELASKKLDLTAFYLKYVEF